MATVTAVTSVLKSLASRDSTNTTRKKSKASSIHPRKLATTTLRCAPVQTSSTGIGSVMTSKLCLTVTIAARAKRKPLAGPAA